MIMKYPVQGSSIQSGEVLQSPEMISFQQDSNLGRCDLQFGVVTTCSPGHFVTLITPDISNFPFFFFFFL